MKELTKDFIYHKEGNAGCVIADRTIKAYPTYEVVRALKKGEENQFIVFTTEKIDYYVSIPDFKHASVNYKCRDEYGPFYLIPLSMCIGVVKKCSSRQSRD